MQPKAALCLLHNQVDPDKEQTHILNVQNITRLVTTGEWNILGD